MRNWYWPVLGLAIGFAVARVKLRYATTIYQVSGSVLLNDQTQRSLTEEAITAQLGFDQTSSVENELQVLKSSSLMRRVVDSLGLHVSYYIQGRVKTTEQYPPIGAKLLTAEPENLAYGAQLRIQLLDDQSFILVRSEEDTLLCQYGTPFRLGEVNYTLEYIGNQPPGTVLLIRVSSPEGVAARYAGALNAQVVGRSNVVSLSLMDPAPEKAVEVIRTLIREYNANLIENKNESGRKTLQFIDERLQYITTELYDVEREVEGYKRGNKLPVGVEERASSYLEKVSAVDEQLMDLELRLAMVNDIENQLNGANSRKGQLPLSSEILSSNALAGLIQDYNKTIAKREELAGTARPDNPVFKNLDNQLAELREAILLSIQTIRRELTARRNTLRERLAPIERQISAIPTNERELLQIMRQQQIKEQLFLFLLQKREETALTVAAQVSNSRILDPPANKGAVSPNRRRIMLMWLLLGFGLPTGVIYFRELLNNRIYSEKEIRRMTSTPFLGQIALARGNNPIVVRKNSRSAVAEMFRLLRTNLQFMSAGKPAQVILVTSSVSGEGKSFVSINLGLSLALSGKKTILLGMDMRKPKLSRYLTERLAPRGIANFLVGSSPLDDLIQPVTGYENIDYLDCGPIPPNPSELIGSPQTEEMFNQLRARYDYIVVDTAPLGLVTDALLLHKLADQTILVTRFGKTQSNFLLIAEDIYRQQRLPRLGIVLNGVKTTVGYGYGGYFGYGYGYGKGYGYYEEESLPR